MPVDEEGGSQRNWADLLAEQARRNSRLFYRLAHGIVRDDGAAEDACQQAFLRAWSQREQLKDPAKLRAWLARSVVNESLQVARRRKIERRVLGRHARSGRRQDDGPNDHPFLRDSVLAAMEKLPETVRAVVAMRVIDGLAGNDVKELLGCSASEVSRLLHDGFERLRPLLTDWKGKDDG